MVLNYIWIAFFLIAFCIALVRLVFMGDTEVFPAITWGKNGERFLSSTVAS